MHEGWLRRMSTNYDKAKLDKKRLNEEINVLERKFKYAGLRTSDKGQICIEFNPIYLVFCVVYHLFWTF